MQQGLTKTELIKRAGVKSDSYYDLAKGEIGFISISTLLKVLEVLGQDMQIVPQGSVGIAAGEPAGVHVKLDRLLAALEQPAAREIKPVATRKPKPPLTLEPMLKVPLRGAVAAGGGTVNEPLKADRRWVEAPATLSTKSGTLIALAVRGESMEPELAAGDVVVVHYPVAQPANRLLKEGALVVVTTDDYEDLVKRYHFDNSTAQDYLVSTNEAYPMMEIPKRIIYVGEVKHVIKK